MWKTRSIFAVLTVLAVTADPAGAKPRLGGTERAVITHVNAIRSDHGLAPVRAAASLNRAADAHSADMLRNDFFAHESSNGMSFDARIRRYHRAGMLGENLAALTDAGDRAATVVRMWMDSPGHRAIILTAGFRRVGVGARTGQLGGDHMTVVTADFAGRR